MRFAINDAATAGMSRPLATLPLLLASVSGCGLPDDPTLYPEFDPASAVPPPALSRVPPNPLRNAFFGDLHIHTSFSSDAYTLGVRALPDDAYTFSKGGEIAHGAGYGIRLSRPLDFAAVTDHAEYLGMLRVSDEGLALRSRSLRDLLLNGSKLSMTRAYLASTLRIVRKGFSVAPTDPQPFRAAWQEIIAAAERHNTPGAFTTFVGYEWSGGKTGMLHRNVLYRSADVPEEPYGAVETGNPEDLWRALEEQRAQGYDVFAIPHNANLSNGDMYRDVSYSGAPISAEDAARRRSLEPLSEILQVKGTSETHPLLSSEDEFADFEILEGIVGGSLAPEQLPGSYARSALRLGLEFAQREGVNPFDFGVIGSSDSHNASSSVEENNHHGKLPLLDGSAAIRLDLVTLLPRRYTSRIRWGAAGLAAVWAEENTRESLFDAMLRKETYATSGPRLRVRFFGGWRFTDALLTRPDATAAAYAAGVPMGGVLPPRGSARAPTFAVFAMKDPEGANLDRVQIVKAWVDADGESFERIYDVAASDGRVANLSTGKLPPVGNSVDLANATYTNAIGSAELRAVWIDPEFDPAHGALYYARVIEIPTPRWSTFDALKLGVAIPEPATIQERAITSAIWFEPGRLRAVTATRSTAHFSPGARQQPRRQQR